MTLCIDENNVSGKAVLRSQYLVMFFFRVPPTPISSLLSSAALELPCTNQVLVSDSDNCSPSRFMSPSMDDESRLLASHCQ